MATRLIYKDETDGSLRIDEDTLNVIRSIEMPIAVCLIVGPYRSGKSFLMNNLLTSNKTANEFAVGHKDTSETKGILVSQRLVQVKSSTCPEEFSVIMMDTEGLEAIKNEKFDTKLFLIGVIMSSMLIYNTKNTLSSDALNKLGFITKIKESIKLSEESNNNLNLSKDCPDFIWVVRDFFLEKTKSAEENLREFLELEPDSEDEDEEEADEGVKYRNSIRLSFLSTFNTRSCAYMVEPELNENSTIRVSRKEFLRKLDMLSLEDLCEEFQRDLHALSDKVLNTIRPKQVGDILLDGPRYAEFLRLAVDAVNSSKAFFMLDVISRITTLEYYAKLEISYEEKLKYLVSKKESRPISLRDFQESEEDIYHESIGILKSMLTSRRLEDEFMPKFNLFRDEKRRHYEKTVLEDSKAFNKRLLEENWAHLKRVKCDPNTLVYTSIDQFDQDIKEFEVLFKQNAVESPDVNSTWNELYPSIQQTRSVVLEAIKERLLAPQACNNASTNTYDDDEDEDEEEEEEEEDEQHVPTQAVRPNLPMTSKGKPDFRFKSVKEYFGMVDPVTGAMINLDGSLDKRFTVNREQLGLINKKAGICLKSDGTLDMRYKVNKDYVKSQTTPTKVGVTSLDFKSPGPVKKDGTPDMRYAVNKQAYAASQVSQSSSSAYSNLKTEPTYSITSSSTLQQVPPGPLKKDGTPDMRYKVNKQAFQPTPAIQQVPITSVKSVYSPPLVVPTGPLKKDGTPDMRYKVNQQAYSSAQSVQSTPPGPLKKDGTPDMRYTVNREYVAAISATSSKPSYSTGASSYYTPPTPTYTPAPTYQPAPPGPLRKDGMPDMRYTVNRNYVASNSAASSSNYSSSFVPSGPLKKDGTPDMRYKANRR